MLTGARVALVPADPLWAPLAAQYYARNQDFLAPFEPAREADFYTEAHQSALLAQAAQSARERRGFRFLIMPAGRTDLVIGQIALSEIVWGAFCSAFLGYKLDGAWQNRGCMTEAVSLIAGFAFGELKLHRIEANVMPRNAASLRVLKKNGFYEEGLARAYLKINDAWEDHIHMVKRNLELE